MECALVAINVETYLVYINTLESIRNVIKNQFVRQIHLALSPYNS